MIHSLLCHNEQRKLRVAFYFSLAREFVGADGSDGERVNFLKELGFSDIDALHIVLAEKCGADYFVTRDDDIGNPAPLFRGCEDCAGGALWSAG